MTAVHHIRIRPATILVALVLAVGAWLALAGSARAAGQITYDGCLANDASQGCFDLPFDPLDQARDVAVSPDGKSVYVVSYVGDSVAHFFRGPGGQISYDGCLANDASNGCFDLPDEPLDGPVGVAVSPDGKSVYVASAISSSVAHFFRDGPDGQISYDGCLANDASDGCFDLPEEPLGGAQDVAVSADGKSVYAVSSGADAVAHFFRGGPDGQISYDGCVANTPDEGCADIPEAPISDPTGVAVSPDGKSVYVTALSGNAVAHLFRGGPDGQISWDSCVNNDGSQNCADAPAAPLTGAGGVAVSPDGKSVYVTAEGIGGVAHLFRGGPDGQISWDGCLNDNGSENCGDLPGTPLLATRGVSVSPDGSSVYVASLGGAIGHFVRGGSDGQVTWGSCVADTNKGGCTDLPAAPIAGASGAAVSPDGRSVYVAAAASNSVAHFFRELDSPPDPAPGPQPEPDPAPGPQPAPGPGADTSPPETVIEKGPKRRTARRTARFRFRASEPGVRFQCKLDRRRWKPCSSPRTLRRLRVGRHRFSIRAIDAAGNVDPTPAKRRWRVLR
jgi:DNA-binding beta-propeller fold protein YncE